MPTDSLQKRRQHLRDKFRKLRRNLHTTERTHADSQITAYLHQYTDDLAAQGDGAPLTIAAYLAADGEVSLAEWLRTTPHQIYLPRINPDRASRTMTLHGWQVDTPLQTNRFGIAEPSAQSPQLEANALDLVLTPLVSFDSRGGRLGMGAGYYDRCFADSRARLVGVAFQCQQSPTPIPTASWDLLLHAVVTERGVLECSTTHANR